MRAAALAAQVCVLACVLAGAARADDAEQVADRAFHAASSRGDIDALEQLGAQRPITRWTDDAWVEAARIAVRANDYARAKRDLEQVIAISSDERLVRRARAELGRIAGVAGTTGEWTQVAAVHERLVPALHAGGDPRPALAELEKLVRANPSYPRAASLMIAIASGWEREGEDERAIEWLRRAQTAAPTPGDRLRAHADLVRTLTRSGRLATAADEIDAIARYATPGLVATLRHSLARAELRRGVRYAMWGVLAVLAALAAFALRRSAGSWRAAARRLMKPPAEALFLVPVAAVLLVVSNTGNPLVARAVRVIVLAGIATSWISGAILDSRRTPLRFSRVALHAGAAVLAVIAATYIAVDSNQMINFVLETWRSGHELDH